MRSRVLAALLLATLFVSTDFARADERLDEAVRKLEKGDVAAARAELEALAKERPADAMVYYHLGSACVLANDFSAAKKAFERTVKLDPGNMEARRVLASLLSREGKHEAAAKQLEPVVQASPGDAKLIAELGTEYARAAQAARQSGGKHRECAEKAIACYRKLLDADPEFAPALYNIGTMQSLLERWEEAEATLASYVEKKPEDLAGLYNLAVAREHACPAERAIETWQVFIAKAKADPKFKRDVPFAERRIKALKAAKKS